MIDKIHDWDSLSLESRASLLEIFLDNAQILNIWQNI